MIGIKFVIRTECQALMFTNTMKTTQPQIVLWLATIVEYDCEVYYRSGVRIRHVDALWRAPVVVEDDSNVGEVLVLRTREEEILLYQRTDDELYRIIEILTKSVSERSREEKGEIEGFTVVNGLLYKKQKDRDGEVTEKYVIPKNMRKAIVVHKHDCASHPDVERTVARIHESFYFANMRGYIKRHIQVCLERILEKNKTGRQSGVLHPIPPSKRPFEVVHVDHLGPFVTSSRGNKYILGIVDNLTKFVQLEVIPNVNAATTVRKLDQFVEKFGAPYRIVSDRNQIPGTVRYRGWNEI